MRVLIINTSDNIGGAAVAAHRLMDALNNNGVKAKMLVRDKTTDSLSVSSLPDSWRLHWNFLWERIVIWLHMGLRRANVFKADIANVGTDITQMQEFKEADIIHLHWVNQGMLSVGCLKKIMESGKRIVWTMHDLWPATAVCHYADNCTGFHDECRQCQLITHSSLPHRVWLRKRDMLRNHRVTFVGCSRWVAAEAAKSSLLSGQKIVAIPNAIDTHVFKPCDRLQCRQQLGLPADADIVLFVSQRVTDPRKGAKFFIEALNSLAAAGRRRPLAVAILGGHAEEVAARLQTDTLPLGYVNDPRQIVRVYSAADVFVLPSMEDNLPNTIMEAMACGIPCVGFNVGGVPEMIDHRQTGFVAEAANAAELADGIRFVLDEADRDSLAEACLSKVAHCWSQQAVSKQYIKVYEHSLTSQKI